MTPLISIYILENEQRLSYSTARLCAKAWRQYKSVLVILPEELNSSISDALWNVENDSFLPHEVNSNNSSLIQLESSSSSSSSSSSKDAVVVFNIQPEKLENIAFGSKCQRYIAVFTSKEPARIHFSYFRKKGFTIKHYLI